MSRTSLKFALEEERFNLKTIGLILILVDLFLLPYIITFPQLWSVFWLLVLYEWSMIVSFLLGLRGQGRYKEAMLHLQSIARNKDLTIDEREAMLVQGVHHHCLELGYIAQKRNKEYGLNFFRRWNNNHKNNHKDKKIKKKRIIIKKEVK